MGTAYLFCLFVSCDGRPFGSAGLALLLLGFLGGSLGGAAGCGLRGSPFGGGLWCPIKLGGSRRLLGFRLGFLCGSLVIPRLSSIGLGWLLRICFLPPVFFCRIES